MVEKAMPITGGCLCGAIRYEASEAPSKIGTCHCRMCQRWSGGPFTVDARFPSAALRFTQGEPKIYRSSAIMERAFCSNCGSSLTYRYLLPEMRSDVVWIKTGTLDHPEPLSPQYHYGVESQMPWLRFDDDLPRTRCDEDPNLAAAFAAASEAKD